MEKKTLNQASFHCDHSPKYMRLTIDGGLGEVFCLELCRMCHMKQQQQFVIKEEVITN